MQCFKIMFQPFPNLQNLCVFILFWEAWRGNPPYSSVYDESLCQETGDLDKSVSFYLNVDFKTM